MSDEQEPHGPQGEISTWKAARDRLFRFARNVLAFEQTMDRLVESHDRQQRLLNDVHNRINRIEAQQEIIIRLLERDKRS